MKLIKLTNNLLILLFCRLSECNKATAHVFYVRYIKKWRNTEKYEL